MPELILPQSFVALLREFSPVFSTPSFANFLVLTIGWLHAPGKRYISNVIRAAGLFADKQFCTYYRFFSHSCWSFDELGLALLAFVINALKLQEVELILDDTLNRRKGKKVALAMMHADPLLREQGGKPFSSYGHVFVVLAVHVVIPRLGRTGWALPFMTRLFESSKQGGRADAPSDQRRAAARRRKSQPVRKRQRLTDRRVLRGKLAETPPQPDTGPLPEDVRPTKLQLATRMILLVAKRFPGIRFRVIADQAYNGHAVLAEVLANTDNVDFIVRGRADAALYKTPPPPTGRRGRPRTRGKKLLNPQTWVQRNHHKLRKTHVEMYGHTVPVLVGSYLGMAYRTLPGRLVRYVIVKDPNGPYGTSYIMSTDLKLTEEENVTSYSHRWPLELTFQETKQKLGMQDPQTQLPASVRRTAPFALFQYSVVVLWYVTVGHDEAKSKLKMRCDIIYNKKTGRPSFSEMLAALRRLGWRRGFLDLPSRPTKRAKMLESYLDIVAAAA